MDNFFEAGTLENLDNVFNDIFIMQPINVQHFSEIQNHTVHIIATEVCFLRPTLFEIIFA